jgi:IclR family transcriptional regulator, mhp operon transcriptional activator
MAILERTNETYKSVRGLTRGLAILETLSENSAERLHIGEIAARVGLHRTTVKRLLETLSCNGYVWLSASDKSYRLTHRVRKLGLGCSDEEILGELAAPHLERLRQAVIWPIDLIINDGDAMYIRETTHRDSPLSFIKQTMNRRLPVLVSASGRAFLAFCAPQRRDLILQSLRKQTGIYGTIARSQRAVDTILARTRSSGYAINDCKWAEDPKVRALAVPIQFNGDVLGCLCLPFVGEAMTIEEAKSRYLQMLLGAVGEIENELKTIVRPIDRRN